MLYYRDLSLQKIIHYQDAYFIDRTVIPNVIKFDVAPIWDQDLGAKTIGEPTAVEKVVVLVLVIIRDLLLIMN